MIYILFLALVAGQIGRLQFNDNIALTLLDIVVFVFFIKHILSQKNFTSFFNPVLRSMLLLVLVSILSLGLHVFDTKTFLLLAPTLYLVRLIVYLSLYFVFFDINQRNYPKLIKSMFVSGILIIVIGFIQLFFYSNLRNLYYLGWDDHLYRMFSVFLDPNFAGAFFALFLFFLCGCMIYFKINNEFLYRLTLIFIPVAFIANLLTQSRSGVLMLVSGITVFLVLLKKKRAILYMIFALIVFYIISSRFFYIENINPFRIASSSSRLESVRNAMVIISDEPVFGVGYNLYGYVQKQYKFIVSRSGVPSHAEAAPDNSILFITATTGVLGLAMFVWMIKALILYKYNEFKQNRNIFALVYISSLAGLLVGSMFINSFFYPAFLVWMAVLFAIKGKI